MHTQGRWFIDSHGRATLLRGVNLGGNCKVPSVPDGRTHLPDDFSRHRTVSFVNRPFPLHEADEHFGRLRHWGFNCLRLLTTWEAIEHAGPGDYDTAYLDYFAALVRRAGDYGFQVFIDPHQDVWSRMSGGDGAPGWTLELAGFDVTRLDASEAALTMQRRYPDYGTMVWSGNRKRLASCTMFTLFLAGERFAPGLRIGGENIQSYLQRHFIAAMQQVAGRLAGMEHVLGYDSLNEPSAGYIGLERLSSVLPISNDGPLMTGFESMIVPAGHTRTVPRQVRHGVEKRIDGTLTLNPDGVSAWAGADVWRAHGVWDVDARGEPVLLRDDYFAGVRFFADCLAPFAQRYARAMRTADPNAILFIEGEPHSLEPLAWPDTIPVVNAGHWYDSLTQRTKTYDPARAIVAETGETVQGTTAVRETFKTQIGRHVTRSERDLGGAPTLLGEFGVPFDLDDGAAFASGDFSAQAAALDTYYDVIDDLLIHSAQWNYTSDNTNRRGDGWNGEDFSIFSRDQQTDPADLNSGGRGLAGFCRPTVRACAGVPLRQTFERDNGRFELHIAANPAVAAPTEVYIPRLHYPGGPDIWVSHGRCEYNPVTQLLTWRCDKPGSQTLTVKRAA